MIINKENIKDIEDLLMGYLVLLKRDSFIKTSQDEIVKNESEIQKVKRYIKALEEILRNEKN